MARRLLWALAALVLVQCGCSVHETALRSPQPHSWATAHQSAMRPCATYGPPTVLGHVKDPRIRELSGLTVSRKNPNVLWVVNDSGWPKIFALAKNGRQLGALHLRGATNLNWEALSLGPCGTSDCLYVGDVGDDYGVRPWKSIYKIVEPEVDASQPFGTRIIEHWEHFRFIYPETPPLRALHDTESMAVHPRGHIVLATKRGAEGIPKVYGLELTSGSAFMMAEDLGYISALVEAQQRITAIDIHPSGQAALLRTYRGATSNGAIFELRFSNAGWTSITAGALREVPSRVEPQGEALAYDPATNGYFFITELNGARHAPIHYVPCLAPAE